MKYQNLKNKILCFKNKILIKLAIFILNKVDKEQFERKFSWTHYVGKIKEYLE